MKRLLFLFFLFTSSVYSQSNSFEEIATSEDGTKYHYKIVEFNLDENKWEIWLKTEYPHKKVKNKKGKLISKYQGYQLQYLVFYCDTKTADVLEYYVYDANGNIESEGNSLRYNTKLIPDTVLE